MEWSIKFKFLYICFWNKNVSINIFWVFIIISKYLFIYLFIISINLIKKMYEALYIGTIVFVVLGLIGCVGFGWYVT